MYFIFLPSENCRTTKMDTNWLFNSGHMICCFFLHWKKQTQNFYLSSHPIANLCWLAMVPKQRNLSWPQVCSKFAQPQCVLASSAEHHLRQDVCNGGRKTLQPCLHIIYKTALCVGNGWHQAVKAWRQFVLFPFTHLNAVFFHTEKNLNSSHLLRPSGPI